MFFPPIDICPTPHPPIINNNAPAGTILSCTVPVLCLCCLHCTVGLRVWSVGGGRVCEGRGGGTSRVAGGTIVDLQYHSTGTVHTGTNVRTVTGIVLVL